MPKKSVIIGFEGIEIEQTIVLQHLAVQVLKIPKDRFSKTSL